MLYNRSCAITNAAVVLIENKIKVSVKKSLWSENKSIKIVEKYSADAVLDFEDDYFDWIYLDANHSYDFVKQDLENWWPKIKNQGFICGNAYTDNTVARNVLDFGVIPAVDNFLEEKLEEICDFEVAESQFAIQKK